MFSSALRTCFAAVAMLPLLSANVGMCDNFAGRMLAAHNRERAAIGVPALGWDAKLAADAAEWAAHLSARNRLAHAPDEGAAAQEGENLWAGTANRFGLEAMVQLWIDEKRDFKPGIFPNNSRSGDIEAVGHYTQLVWRATAKVGCALGHGREYDFLVCRYTNPGNVMGDRAI